MAFLEFKSVSKSFPGVKALDAVSFDVSEGSVHGLCGENGAGKSTLLKILSGVYRPDAGSVYLGGQPAHFRSAADAIAAGVAVIYQELHLVPEMTVAENLYLGHLPNRLGWLNRKQLIDQAVAQLEGLEMAISPSSKVSSLPIAQRQMVEIAKALSRKAKVIAFDEPSSSLSSREVDRLFQVIASLKRSGHVILYVSHRIEEIFGICDSATVLRDGKHVETFKSLDRVDTATLVGRMVGRSIEDIFSYRPRTHGDEALRVKGIMGPGLGEPASLSVSQGEIVGLFGLVGAGRTELAKLIYGSTHATSGTVSVLGTRVHIRSPRDAIRAGIIFCPEDRKKESIIPVRSVLENINLSGRRKFSHLGFFINQRQEIANAQRHIDKLRVRTPSLWQVVNNLSGGNQQKVVLARWLSEDLKVILLDEPTRGIDVGAKSEIYSIIYELAERGIGVVVVSSELPEVLGICDRILVMRQGKIAACLARGQSTQEQLLHLALPVAAGAPAAVSA